MQNPLAEVYCCPAELSWRSRQSHSEMLEGIWKCRKACFGKQGMPALQVVLLHTPLIGADLP